jgi:hypothetical protein
MEGVKSWVLLQTENLIERCFEDLGKEQGEGEAGNVASALDGVNALAGDAGGGGEVLLGPCAGGAQVFYAIEDGRLHGKSAFHERMTWRAADVKPTLRVASRPNLF